MITTILLSMFLQLPIPPVTWAPWDSPRMVGEENLPNAVCQEDMQEWNRAQLNCNWRRVRFASYDNKVHAPAGQKFEYVLHADCIGTVHISQCHGPAMDQLHCDKLIIDVPATKKLIDCFDINVVRVPAEEK